MSHYLGTLGGHFRFEQHGDTMVVTSHKDDSFECRLSIPEDCSFDTPHKPVDRVLYDTFFADVRAAYQEST